MTIISRCLITFVVITVLMTTVSMGMAVGPSADMYPGSLQGNINRLSRVYGWPQVVWNVPDDYHWVGHVRVAANNLPDILRSILMNYPLQADFYEGNHILVIQPRTLPA